MSAAAIGPSHSCSRRWSASYWPWRLYTAAGISGASPAKTGYTAFLPGIASYIVSFKFVYKPALVLSGTVYGISRDTLIPLVAIYCCAVLAHRYRRIHIKPVEALLLAAPMPAAVPPFFHTIPPVLCFTKSLFPPFIVPNPCRIRQESETLPGKLLQNYRRNFACHPSFLWRSPLFWCS